MVTVEIIKYKPNEIQGYFIDKPHTLPDKI